MKPRTVSIPVDGSFQAEEAVRTLQGLSLPERVLLLHSISIPQLAYPGTGMSIGRDFSQAAEHALREEGSRILEKAASLLPPECGQVSQHLEIGDPAPVILSMAQQCAYREDRLDKRDDMKHRKMRIGMLSFAGGPCVSGAGWSTLLGLASVRSNEARRGVNGFGAFCRNTRASPAMAKPGTTELHVDRKVGSTSAMGSPASTFLLANPQIDFRYTS